MPRWPALVPVLLVLAVPAAQACADASAQVSLEFPDLPRDCKRGSLDPCLKVPDADTPLVLAGTLVWTSEADTACSLGPPSAGPVTINLQGLVRSAEGWLAVTADPSEIVIPVQDQYDLTDDEVDPAGARVRSTEGYPVTVTIALVGEPSQEALDILASTGGSVPLAVKAVMGATSAFTQAYDFQAFTLDGRATLGADAGGHGAPGLAPLMPALALAALAAALRRR